MSIREKIWGDTNPYSNVSAGQIDTQGWREDHPMLMSAAKNAKTMAEVGVWKGRGVMSMAKANPDAEILAVDHWRGSFEHWTRPRWRPEVTGNLYDQFRRNMIWNKLTDQVTPLPLDSINAAGVCGFHNIEFDLIHIDGAHDLDSVLLDLNHWGELVSDGGIIIMDDVNCGFHGVDEAIVNFCFNSEWKAGAALKGKAILRRA